jgi:hypothetical protein
VKPYLKSATSDIPDAEQVITLPPEEQVTPPQGSASASDTPEAVKEPSTSSDISEAVVEPSTSSASAEAVMEPSTSSDISEAVVEPSTTSASAEAVMEPSTASDPFEAVVEPTPASASAEAVVERADASTGVFRPIEDLVQVSKGHATAHVFSSMKEWPEHMGQPRFSALQSSPDEVTLDLHAWSMWCDAHFGYKCIRNYSGPLFDKGWYGTLSGEEWATMYYLGFAERMPEGMVYEGPARLERAKPPSIPFFLQPLVSSMGCASDKSDDAEKIPDWMF